MLLTEKVSNKISDYAGPGKWSQTSGIKYFFYIFIIFRKPETGLEAATPEYHVETTPVTMTTRKAAVSPIPTTKVPQQKVQGKCFSNL